MQSQLAADFHEFTRRDLVAPLIQTAMEAKDPLQRTRLVMLAENCGEYFFFISSDAATEQCRWRR